MLCPVILLPVPAEAVGGAKAKVFVVPPGGLCSDEAEIARHSLSCGTG